MESLRNNLPLISLCLLIIGTLNLLVYYDYFDINILAYLDLTEVFQLQFRFFVVSVVYLLAMLFYTLLTPSSSRPNPHEIAASIEAELKKSQAAPTMPLLPREEHAEETVEVLTKKIHDELKKRDVPLVAVLAFVMFVVLAKWWGNVRTELSTVVYVLMWVELVLFVIILYFFHNQIKRNFIDGEFGEDSAADVSRKVVLVNILLALAFTASILARMDAMLVMSSPSDYQVTAQFEDTTLVTNTNFRFVGKTKNNIFFYDVEKHQAEVYSNDKLKSFVVRDLRKFRVSANKKNLHTAPIPIAPKPKSKLKL
jgi:hypothetical protein